MHTHIIWNGIATDWKRERRKEFYLCFHHIFFVRSFTTQTHYTIIQSDRIICIKYFVKQIIYDWQRRSEVKSSSLKPTCSRGREWMKLNDSRDHNNYSYKPPPTTTTTPLTKMLTTKHILAIIKKFHFSVKWLFFINKYTYSICVWVYGFLSAGSRFSLSRLFPNPLCLCSMLFFWRIFLLPLLLLLSGTYIQICSFCSQWNLRAFFLCSGGSGSCKSDDDQVKKEIDQ